jgi:recombination protein RecA
MAKKKKVAKEAKTSTLDAAKKAIRKKYGDVIGYMGDKDELVIDTISTGSLGLDAALGRGGFALGRVYEIYGQPSGGKTTLAMSIIAQAQKRGLKCVFVDVEHSADPQLFKAMNVNLDDLITIDAFIGDDNLDALETLIKTNEIDVAVVDSVSALIPSAEAAAEIGDDFMGLLARLMSKAMRRLTPIVSETETLLIFVNQIRYKIGSWGDPQTTTGGEALNFYSTGRIAVSGGEFKKSLITDPITSDVVGHETLFHIRKNKLAPPFRNAKVPLIYGKGYDVEWEVLQLAESLAVIQKNGAWYSYKDENIAQGELNARDYLKENRDVYEEVREQLIELMGLKEAYEHHSK